jgi:transcription-repair coupling factor (superfamily II helicase)
MEHWLPLYYDRLETLFDYIPEATITLDNQAEQSREMRLQQVEDLYQARMIMLKAEQKDKPAQYRPVPVNTLYLPQVEWQKKIGDYEAIDLSPFSAAPSQKDGGGKKGRDFGDIRAQTALDLYATIREHIETLNKAGKKVLVAAYSEGAKERLKHLLEEQGLYISPKYDLAILGLEHGFETADFAVLTEQDLLGDRLSRTTKKRKKSDSFMRAILSYMRIMASASSTSSKQSSSITCRMTA